MTTAWPLRLSFGYPYYLNPGMLAVQYRAWERYPPALARQIEIVVVDDGSPSAPAVDVPRPPALACRLRICRIGVDIPWNNHGARNLAARVAEGAWLWLSDIDHVVPSATLGRMLAIATALPATPTRYTFQRLDAPDLQPKIKDGRPHPHRNSFLVPRAAYWQAGGYDEDYCGIYGLEGLFLHRLDPYAPEQHLADAPILRYGREVIPDASTTTLPRKSGRDVDAVARVRARKQAEGRTRQITTLNFPWSCVYDSLVDPFPPAA
jgi:hypothetical protein